MEDTNLIVDDEYCCRRSSTDLIIIRHCRGSTHADTGRQRRQHGRKTRRVVVVIPTPAAPTEEDLRRRIIVAIARFVQPDGNTGRAMAIDNDNDNELVGNQPLHQSINTPKSLPARDTGTTPIRYFTTFLFDGQTNSVLFD